MANQHFLPSCQTVFCLIFCKAIKKHTKIKTFVFNSSLKYPSLSGLSLQQFVRMLILTETAAWCRGAAAGPHSPRPTPGETLLREPPLLRQSQVRSEQAPGRAAAVFARVGSLQCRKGQGAPRVPGSDGRTAQRARRRPPSATRPRRRRFPRARFGGGAAR